MIGGIIMKNMLAALVVVGAATTVAPLSAAAAPSQPAGVSVPSTVEAVQYRRGFYRHGGGYYFNGHRGYSYYRPGYRRYGNWWFPGAAFAAGAVIGGAIASEPGPVYAAPTTGEAHAQWCMQTYRSYNPADDTYQPYNGPRQPCVSPY
jgi:hypothetical protein